MTARRLLSFRLPEGSIPGAASGASDDPLKALTDLALWCQQYSPLTAIDPPDGVLIDITGCAHLFGGEAGLSRRIQSRFPDARIAIGPTATAAWGLARYGEAGADLESLPLAALRLPAATVTRLRRVGIRRIGELMRLPRAELTAGYGPEPALKLAQALGQAPEVLRFLSPPPDWQEAEQYAEPIFAPLQLQSALTRLAAKLCARLANGERGATALVARFYRIDSRRPEFALGFAAPTRDEFHIGRLLIEKLARNIDPGFGIEAISLVAATTEPCPPTQRGTEQPAPEYGRALDTMLNRLGPQNLWRVKMHKSHIPEHAVRRIAITAPPALWVKPRHPRPVQLLRKPAAITAIAPVPDDPPVMFAWRGNSHRIANATGPERIARDWWRHTRDNARPETDRIRDYYAVQDTSGARFWIFRAGTHGGVAPPRWYLHGFFG